jgi:hypothetical protein
MGAIYDQGRQLRDSVSGRLLSHPVASYDGTLAGSINSMLRKRSQSNKALYAQLGQASWSLPGLLVAGNML